MRDIADGALDAVATARGDFTWLREELNVLDAEQKAMFERWRVREETKPLSPEEKTEFEMELRALTERLRTLVHPWHEAQRTLEKLQETAGTIMAASGNLSDPTD